MFTAFILAVIHFIANFLWREQKVHWFFVGVGADQVVHYGCLFFTYQWLLQ